jgi:O-antigen ligase
LVGLAAGVGALAGHNAQLALAAAAALLFVALVWSNYPAAVGVFIVVTFFENAPGIVVKGIGLVLVLAWFAMLATRSSADFADFAGELKGFTILLVAFIGWILLSISWAQSPAAVLSSASRYVPNMFVFFLIYAAGEKRSRAQLLLGFFVLAAAIAAADGVIHPPPASSYSGDVSRTGGTVGDPNGLAAVLVAGLAISAAVASMRSLLPVIRIAAMITCALSVAGILLSVSRGGLIALGVALVASVVVAGRWRARMGAVMMVVVLSSVAYFSVYASASVRDHLTANNGGSGRTDIWTIGWRMVQAHPLNGVGAGNFSIASPHYLLRPGLTTHAQYVLDSPKVAHNTYLEILAEGGIPALILFLGIIAASLRCIQLAWRAFRDSGDSEMELLAYALFSGLIGFLVAAFFLSQEHNKQLWILLAFGPFLLRISSLPAFDDPPSAAAAGPPDVATLSSIDPRIPSGARAAL